MRLGLTQLIRGMAGSWDVVPLDARAIDEFAYLACDVDLVVLGMPLELTTGWKMLSDIERLLRPHRVLLLAEPGVPWEPPPGGLPPSVYGCISSTASIDVVEAAIRLSVAVTDSGHATRSTVLASPGSVFVGISPGGPARPVEVAELAHAAPAPSAPSAPIAPAPAPAAAFTSASSVAAPGPQAAHAPPSTAIQPPRPAQAIPAQACTLDAATGAQLLNVTPRQYEVLTLLARGYPIKTVSRILNISTATAKAHASTLYQRLRVSSKGEAVYAARQRGIHFD